MANDAWVCPHCNFAQVLLPAKKYAATMKVQIDGLAEGQCGYHLIAYGCSNPACMKVTTNAFFGNVESYSSPGRAGLMYYMTVHIAGGAILPRGSSKPQPSYIPVQLREDYEQACAIRDQSPKAAATLVRRCLQGMIRDFCNIRNQPTLFKEIDALRKLVDEGKAPSGVTYESVDAIDHVRGIGNIGAHMEKDVDHIVDVDPNEAQALIELVEMLFDEWYVARQKRADRLRHITEIASAKVEAKSGGDTVGTNPRDAATG